ncbi:hypothetical protein Tco_0952389 [Tanacetum coccineum]|uniref:Uncharacterized protein n=1 Tax=Tanacetum coccineum TaxID=301880 RepID=A0ABQ5E3A6_9ASTR
MERAATTASSLDEEQESDGQLKTITEASFRRHLKLEDADGISSLPNTEIFKQLALMRSISAFSRVKDQQSPTEYLDQEEPTELVEDFGSDEKGEKEISTANISVSTASATPEVSTAAKNLVYIRRSAEKRKDKGKAIIERNMNLFSNKAKQATRARNLRQKKLLDCMNK